jgi:hypothetical protein
VDAAKVALAVRLCAETVMTVKWIAERLGMGTPGLRQSSLVSATERRAQWLFNLQNATQGKPSGAALQGVLQEPHIIEKQSHSHKEHAHE